MQNLREVAYLYFMTTKLPITLLDAQGGIIEQLGVSKTQQSLLLDLPINKVKNNEYYNHTAGDLHFISMQCQCDNRDVFIVVGPYRYLCEQTATVVGNAPCMTSGETQQHYKLLEKLFACGDLKFNRVDKSLSPSAALEKNIIEYREIDFFHHDIGLEYASVSQMFRDGDATAFREGRALMFANSGQMTQSKKANNKNWFVIGIGLFTRKAIELGVNPHHAFTISDSFLRRIDETDNQADMDMINHECFRALYNAVNKSNAIRYSKITNDALTIIDRNLSQKLSLNELASQLRVSPSNLSRLFKKETGYSFSDFLLNKRIEEAKRLLDYSQHNLTEISGILNFSTKSYFISCFKKVTGKTPNEYRNAS